jgi:UDP-N-acetylmuramate dehydrogenase
MAALTTLRVGGPAQQLFVVDSAEAVVETVRACDRDRQPLLVIGQGSNLVVSDSGVSGAVVRVATRGIEVTSSDDDSVTLRLAAGESWDELVSSAVNEGWAGVEAMSGIPGLVGATPIQNVGAYGQEVSDVITGVEVLDREKGRLATLSPVECGFGYRTSAFKSDPRRFVVLFVTVRLSRSPVSRPLRYTELVRALGIDEGAEAALHDVRDCVLSLRRSKGMVLDERDHDTWSAGSFFTNPVLNPDEAARLPDGAPRWSVPIRPGAPESSPAEPMVKTSAAWLIEAAGFAKGYGAELGTGRARLSTKHPLAVTNTGDATAAEVMTLARSVAHGVQVATGVRLIPEPTLVSLQL